MSFKSESHRRWWFAVGRYQSDEHHPKGHKTLNREKSGSQGHTRESLMREEALIEQLHGKK